MLSKTFSNWLIFPAKGGFMQDTLNDCINLGAAFAILFVRHQSVRGEDNHSSLTYILM